MNFAQVLRTYLNSNLPAPEMIPSRHWCSLKLLQKNANNHRALTATPAPNHWKRPNQTNQRAAVVQAPLAGLFRQRLINFRVKSEGLRKVVKRQLARESNPHTISNERKRTQQLALDSKISAAIIIWQREHSFNFAIKIQKRNHLLKTYVRIMLVII